MPAHLFKWILVLVTAVSGAAACGSKEPPPKRKARSGVSAPSRTEPAKTGPTPEAAKAPEKAPEPSGPEPPGDSVAALQRNYDRAKAAFKQHQGERTQGSYDRAKTLLLQAKEVADRLEAAGKSEQENVIEIIGDVNYLLRTLPDYPPE